MKYGDPLYFLVIMYHLRVEIFLALMAIALLVCVTLYVLFPIEYNKKKGKK